MLVVTLVMALFYGLPVVDRSWFGAQRQLERERVLDSYYQLRSLATEIEERQQEVDDVGRKIRYLNTVYLRPESRHSMYEKFPDDANNETVWCQELMRSIAEKNRLVVQYNDLIDHADPVMKDPGLRLVAAEGEKLDLLQSHFSHLTIPEGCSGPRK
ncbi:hypothetical protein HYT05_01720 [Candidatus Kaiserbacteria bacterium]|nr:hypothetical protein [Candidatus Kaiserbacteria bacterium]